MPKPLKKEKGWRITTFTVTVKHRPYEPRKFIGMDMAHTLRDRDEIKGVRVKVAKAPRQLA